MNDEKQKYCELCRQKANHAMNTILSTGSEILILILNLSNDISIKINFVVQLNLIGVFSCLDNISQHFISFCKSPIDKNWYQYNDSIIKEVNDFKTEVIDGSIPYVLFYQKIH